MAALDDENDVVMSEGEERKGDKSKKRSKDDIEKEKERDHKNKGAVSEAKLENKKK